MAAVQELVPASFTRLRSGDWGVRVRKPEAASLAPGDSVQVQKRSGEVKIVQIGGCAKTFDDAALFEIAPRGGEARRSQGELAITEEGMYEHDEVVFKVVRGKTSGNLYAKKLVRLRDGQQDRVNENDSAIRWTFEYDGGAVFKLKPEELMTFERAKELSQKFGICVRCGATLEAKKSVAEGIGPVCRKAFRR